MSCRVELNLCSLRQDRTRTSFVDLAYMVIAQIAFLPTGAIASNCKEISAFERRLGMP